MFGHRRAGATAPSTTSGSSSATASQLTSARRCRGPWAACSVAQLATASSSIPSTGLAPKLVPSACAAFFPRPLRQRWLGASALGHVQPRSSRNRLRALCSRTLAAASEVPSSAAIDLLSKVVDVSQAPRPDEVATATGRAPVRAAALRRPPTPMPRGRARDGGRRRWPRPSRLGRAGRAGTRRTGEMVAGTVSGHSVEPSREARLTPKSREAAEGPQVGLLVTSSASSSLPVSR